MSNEIIQDEASMIEVVDNYDFWQDVMNGVPDEYLEELNVGLEETTYTSDTIMSENSLPNWSDEKQLLRSSTNFPLDAFDSQGVLNGTQPVNTLALSQQSEKLLLSALEPIKIKIEPVDSTTLQSASNNTQTTSNTKEEIIETEETSISYKPSTSSKDEIKELYKLVKTYDVALSDIETKQRKVEITDKDAFSQLQQSLFKLHQQLDKSLKDSNDLLKGSILKPTELRDLYSLQEQFNFQLQRVALYQLELNNMAKDEEKSVASIAIQQQPLSQVVFKGRAIEGTYLVKVISGAKVKIGDIEPIVALFSEEAKAQKPLEANKMATNSSFIADFPGIKINISTRMTPSTLHFTSRFKDGNKKSKEWIDIDSNESNPVIVITNESQWGEAAGKLLFIDTFKDLTEISWPNLANTIQSLVLQATQQSLEAPQRPLVDWEFSFVHAKFFNREQKIKKGDAQKFWAWFGQVLTTIKFKRHIKTLWVDGYIIGLISKKDCETILKTEEVGTFIIRFSDSLAGSFAVAYVTDDPNPDRKVKHFLIKPEEVGSNRALPDFLREKPQFKYLIFRDPKRQKLYKAHKDKAFENKYSKKKVGDQPDNHIRNSK